MKPKLKQPKQGGPSGPAGNRARPPRKRTLRFVVGALLVLALAATLTWGILRPAAFKAPFKHIVVISLDTVRADHFGCYGNPWIKTPRMDALAKESILFANFVTVVPTTLPSHVTLFTGKYPHNHGTPSNGFTVNPQNVLLPEILKEKGFRCAGFLGSFILDRRFGFAQGFDHYDEKFDRLFGTKGFEADERSAEAVNQAVFSYLDQTGVPANLFLFVHYYDAHRPYLPPPPYDTLYDPRGRTEMPRMRDVVQSCAANPGQETPDAKRAALQYAGEISYLDEQIGRLLDDLKKRGILDEALLIITSDHGENMWEHRDYFDHQPTIYETLMHSVGLVRLPKAAHGGARVDARVANTDILPTALKYAGLPVPNGLDGEALDLNNPQAIAPRGLRFGESTEPWDNQLPPNAWPNLRKGRCVWDGSWKYILTPLQNTEELYDLSRDPLERNNLLAAATPEITAKAAELRRKVEQWTRTGRPLPSRFEPSLAEETRRRLQALGYAAPGAPREPAEQPP